MKRVTTLIIVMILPILSLGQSWIARYNGIADSTDNGQGIVVDGTGNVYVTGTSLGSGSYTDYATVKYNASGVEQWVRRYNGPANMYDEGKAIAFDGSYVYVTGSSMDPNLYTDMLTIKYDAAGDTQWTRRYDGAANYDDLAFAVGVDRSANVYVAGYASGTMTGWDYALVKYNSAGVQQWVRQYITNDQDYIVAIVIDNSGNVYVTGSSGDPYFMTWDYVTIKYNPAGDTLWLRRYNGPANGHDEARAIALDSSGNVYVTGGSVGTGSSWDYTTIKYNDSGVEQWVVRYNGPANIADWGNAITVDGTGNIYVTGSSASSGSDVDYATVKYNTSGVEQWTRRYNGPASGYDEAMAIATDGSNVYVTGKSTASNLYADYLTIKYNPAGDSLWTKRYNGPADNNDNASAVVADGSGFVYVTGASMGPGSDFDYATIKYPGVGVQEECVKAMTPASQPLLVSPNPFSGKIDIRCMIQDTRYQTGKDRSQKQDVRLKIFDASGRVVKDLSHYLASSILHPASVVSWDGRDDLGRQLPSGVYFVELTVNPQGAVQTGGFRATRTLIRARPNQASGR